MSKAFWSHLPSTAWLLCERSSMRLRRDLESKVRVRPHRLEVRCWPMVGHPERKEWDRSVSGPRT